MKKCGFDIFPYCIDWSATGAMLGGASAIITSVAVIVSAVIAWRTFENWQVRESFSSKRELAVQVLATFFEGKQVIESIRRKYISPEEKEKVARLLLGLEGEIANKSTLLDFSDEKELEPEVIMHRIDLYSEYWRRLNFLLLTAKAVFGNNVRNGLLSILAEKQELEIKCRSFHAVSDKEKNEYRRVLFQKTGLTLYRDEVMDRLDTAEKMLNELLQRYIQQSDAI